MKSFAAVAIGGLLALSVLLEPNRERVITLAAHSRLPAVYAWRGYADAGGLMAYAPNRDELSQRTASFVDRILKGAQPADLPIEQPTRWELIINRKTAKSLGLSIPPSLLRLAQHIIE